MELRLSGCQPLDLDILPLHTRGPAGSQGFECRFFRGEARGEVNRRIGALVAVSAFDFRIYSVEESRSELLDGFPDALVLNDVDADTDDHRCMLQVNRVSQITVLSSPALSAIPGIVHGFSTRRAEHNEFTVGPLSSQNPLIQVNRTRFLAAAGMAGWPLLKLKQTHSGVVQVLRDTLAAGQALPGDAAVTGLRGAALGVQTADCVPILIADRHARVVAAVHAGWRGTAAGIAGNTVKQMADAYGVSPADLTAVIGPHNAVCCYEVGEEVVEAVNDPDAIVRKPGWERPHLNQALANKHQLMEAGIPESQITVSNLCTQCRADLFYSYRRDAGQTGRMLAVIGILP